MRLHSATVYRPSTLDDACTTLAESSSQIINGGTCLFSSLKDMPVSGVLLDLSRLKELKAIQTASDSVRIGARTTWSEIAAAELPPCFDALKQAARSLGSLQIQNVATIAGNLCNASLTADGVPPLLVLDAEVELMSSAGQRRIRLSDFIVGHRETLLRGDEILTAIVVPRTIDEGASVYLKLGVRRSLVTSIATVAAIVEKDAWGCVRQTHIAVGSCSPVAQRLFKLEHTLVGKVADSGLGDLAMEVGPAPLSRVEGVDPQAAYRLDAVRTLVRRAIDACVKVR